MSTQGTARMRRPGTRYRWRILRPVQWPVIAALAIQALTEGFTFTPEETESLARDEHERWWKERVADDWTFASKKNVERKQSPYLVDWEQLSEEIREYDRNAVRGIPAFLARAGTGS